MAKLKKSTKKFVKNKLDHTIKERKNRQKKTNVVQKANYAKKANALRNTSQRGAAVEADEGDASGQSEAESGDEEKRESKGNGKMGVDEFMGGGFAEGMDDGSEVDDEDASEEDDDESLQDIEDLSDQEEEDHAQDLAKLAKKDPEFYKYLQENDQELLDFGNEEDDDGEDDDDDNMEGEVVSEVQIGKQKATEKDAEVVTSEMLKGWQKSILQTHSLKAFRRLLLAFRAAAHMGDEEADGSESSYVVNDAAVFNKLIMTALKYVPVVLQHHIPSKELPNGKFRLPTNNRTFGALMKSVQSFFSSLHRLLKTLPEPRLLYVCVSESSKMVPFLMPNRRMSREYIKILLNLWSTSEENVRIGSFLCIRKMAAAGDEAMLDLCLKGAYHAIVRNTKTTTIYNIDSINLMKNSASELYSLNLVSSYQQAFGFIRQLAIHLRNCLKTKSAESYQAVYNWQYTHCLDFWSIVLSTTCDKEKGEESIMQPLIYPLVQAATGSVRLIPTSRYFPLRFHVIQSLLRLMQRTGVYIPLAPMLLEMLESTEFTRKSKPSTLNTLDFQIIIRIPKAYVRTKVYADQIVEETVYFLLEFLNLFSKSIAFPELVVPITITLKRIIKTSKVHRDVNNAKLVSSIKSLLEKMQRQSEYLIEKRNKVDFAPKDVNQVLSFLSKSKFESPIEAATRLARKVRTEKRALLQQQSQKIVEDGDEDDDE
ncbi:hypothetical protein CBS101457_003496 [Exobasidium rhododendri]|nr:hypothetical protein CBS101457_003496 [Exobasidium rhododendri]